MCARLGPSKRGVRYLSLCVGLNSPVWISYDNHTQGLDGVGGNSGHASQVVIVADVAWLAELRASLHSQLSISGGGYHSSIQLLVGVFAERLLPEMLQDVQTTTPSAYASLDTLDELA